MVLPCKATVYHRTSLVAMSIAHDTLPSTVPKLDPSGSNWLVYRLRFTQAVKAKGKWGHFDGTSYCPQAVDVAVGAEGAVAGQAATPGENPVPAGGEGNNVAAQLNAAETLLHVQEKWDSDEDMALYLLSQRIPDSSLIQLERLKTCKLKWDSLVNEFTQKSLYAQTSLRSEFLRSKCQDGANVRDFLSELRTKRETLSQSGVEISTEDYRATIIQSLPRHLANFASSQLTSMQMAARGFALLSISGTSGMQSSITPDSLKKMEDVDPDVLIHIISDEYERGQRERALRGPSSKPKKDSKDETLYTSKDSGDKNKRAPRGACWICGKKGHFRSDCPKKGKAKSKDSANAVNDSSGDGVWCVHGDVDLKTTSSDDLVSKGMNDGNCLKVATNPGEWRVLFDCASSFHICPQRDAFKTFWPVQKSLNVIDEHKLMATGKGTAFVHIPGTAQQIELKDCLFVPNASATLISVGALTCDGYQIHIKDEKFVLRNAAGSFVTTAQRSKNMLYPLHGDRQLVALADVPVTLMELHARLGHVSPQATRHMVAHGHIIGVKLTNNTKKDCKSCEYGKMTRAPVAKQRSSGLAEAFGDIIYSDVWMSPIQSQGGAKYFVSFTDDATRVSRLYFLKTKDQVLASFKKYVAWAETQQGAKVRVLHSDRGGEYTGNEFCQFLDLKGIQQKLTVHDTPEHNGVAERLNRTLLERARAILHASGLPKNLWAEAVRHVNFLKNRVSTRALAGKTPYEALKGSKPNVSTFAQWGSECSVHSSIGSKLDSRARKARWLGLDETSNGHRVYWNDTKTVGVERTVSFPEYSSLEGEEDDLDAYETKKTHLRNAELGIPSIRTDKVKLDTPISLPPVPSPTKTVSERFVTPPEAESDAKSIEEEDSEAEDEDRAQREAHPSYPVDDILKPDVSQAPRRSSRL